MANKLSQKKLQNKFKKFCQILNKKNFQIFLSDKAKFVPPSKSRRIKYNSIFVCNFASNLFNAPGIKFAIKSAAHEIGHFLAASPQRRKRKNFSIPKPKYINGIDRRQRKYSIEEYKAEIIRAEITVILGLNNRNNYFKQSKQQSNISLKEYYDFTIEEIESIMLWWKSSGKQLTYKFMNV